MLQPRPAGRAEFPSQHAAGVGRKSVVRGWNGPGTRPHGGASTGPCRYRIGDPQSEAAERLALLDALSRAAIRDGYRVPPAPVSSLLTSPVGGWHVACCSIPGK